MKRISPIIVVVSVALGVVRCLMAAPEVVTNTSTLRSITADVNDVKGPRSMVWQDCVGAGRVAEGLRDTWRRQLEKCQREIGFKYLRMHGLLEDELGVCSEDSQGRPSYNWQYIDDVYDYLLSINVKPFVEFGFMPSKLASGKAKIFWWNGHVTPPKDYAKWDALITALVRHWTERYGEAEVATWRFEVWNEPNYPGFWQPPTNTTPRDAYFKLYEHTARAVKGVSTNYPVGGPAGAGPVWTTEIIDFCREKNIPLDFISYHAYGLGDGPSGLDQYGNNKLYLSENIRSVADIVNSQLPVIAKSARPELPIYITEWSASYSPRDPVHDSHFSAPFILEQLRRTEAVKSMSYWTFTDVFEENGPVPRPFHGGFGLINFQGIPKSAFWAYQFLATLGATELKNADASSYICKDDRGGVQVLIWDITHPTGGKVSNQEYFFTVRPTEKKSDVEIRLQNLAPGSYQMTVQRIGFESNDPYSAYLKSGEPENLSRELVAQLQQTSTGKAELSQRINVVAGKAFTTTLPLRANDVVLLRLERDGATASKIETGSSKR